MLAIAHKLRARTARVRRRSHDRGSTPPGIGARRKSLETRLPSGRAAGSSAPCFTVRRCLRRRCSGRKVGSSRSRRHIPCRRKCARAHPSSNGRRPPIGRHHSIPSFRDDASDPERRPMPTGSSSSIRFRRRTRGATARSSSHRIPPFVKRALAVSTRPEQSALGRTCTRAPCNSSEEAVAPQSASWAALPTGGLRVSKSIGLTNAFRVTGELNLHERQVVAVPVVERVRNDQAHGPSLLGVRALPASPSVTLRSTAGVSRTQVAAVRTQPSLIRAPAHRGTPEKEMRAIHGRARGSLRRSRRWPNAWPPHQI